MCERKYTKCLTKSDAHDKMGFQYISTSVYIGRSHAQIQRGDRGSRAPPPPVWKITKNIEFLSNTGPDPLKFSKLPSQHSTLGHHRRVSLAGHWWPALSDIWILSPLKTLSEFGFRSDPNGIQERMFRQFKHLGTR